MRHRKGCRDIVGCVRVWQSWTGRQARGIRFEVAQFLNGGATAVDSPGRKSGESLRICFFFQRFDLSVQFFPQSGNFISLGLDQYFCI